MLAKWRKRDAENPAQFNVTEPLAWSENVRPKIDDETINPAALH